MSDDLNMDNSLNDANNIFAFINANNHPTGNAGPVTNDTLEPADGAPTLFAGSTPWEQRSEDKVLCTRFVLPFPGAGTRFKKYEALMLAIVMEPLTLNAGKDYVTEIKTFLSTKANSRRIYNDASLQRSNWQTPAKHTNFPFLHANKPFCFEVVESNSPTIKIPTQ